MSQGHRAAELHKNVSVVAGRVFVTLIIFWSLRWNTQSLE